MENASLNSLFGEIKMLRKEVRELRGSLIPVENISKAEHVRLDSVFEEMRQGKATPWRDALKK